MTDRGTLLKGIGAWQLVRKYQVSAFLSQHKEPCWCPWQGTAFGEDLIESGASKSQLPDKAGARLVKILG